MLQIPTKRDQANSDAYGDARTPPWLNQTKIYNVCLKFVSKCSLCSIYEKHSGIRWCQDSNLDEQLQTNKFTEVIRFASFGIDICNKK